MYRAEFDFGTREVPAWKVDVLQAGPPKVGLIRGAEQDVEGLAAVQFPSPTNGEVGFEQCALRGKVAQDLPVGFRRDTEVKVLRVQRGPEEAVDSGEIDRPESREGDLKLVAECLNGPCGDGIRTPGCGDDGVDEQEAAARSHLAATAARCVGNNGGEKAAALRATERVKAKPPVGHTMMGLNLVQSSRKGEGGRVGICLIGPARQLLRCRSQLDCRI